MPIVINQFNSSLLISAYDMTLNVDDFQNNVLAPQLSALFSKIDADGFALVNQTPQFGGTPGTAIQSSFLEFPTAKKQCILQGLAPQDDQFMAVLHPDTMVEAVSQLKGLFNATEDISKQYKSGVMGQGFGMKWTESQNAPTHTVGTYGNSTPVMSGSTADGATQVVMSGWASSGTTLNAGDVIQIAGVYAVNPVTKLSTGDLMPFVITTTVSDVSGTVTAQISPAIQLSGPTQNVTALPVSTALIYLWGVHDSSSHVMSGIVSPTSVVMHKQAFGLAMADLALPDGGMGSRARDKDGLNFPIRVVKWYDGRNDDTLYRVDVLYGWSQLRAKFASRVMA